MNKLSVKVKSIYYATIQSIAFYPAIISIAFFLFALLALYTEFLGISQYIKGNLAFIMVDHVDTARSVVNTLMGGIITLTVFSFSMVMLVLNQASASFTPRVIPGLITQKSNQIVLGFYLGTIIYLLLISSNIQSDFFEFEIPRIAIFLGICFGLACLGLFVYFISSISNSIQIGNIVKQLYKQTKKKLESEIDSGAHTSESEISDTNDWKVVKSPLSGYLHKIEVVDFLHIAEENRLKIQFLIPIGSFIVKNNPLMKIENASGFDQEIEERLLKHCIFFHQEIISQNFIHGFKHITEIAVKALSPAINDPGTAKNCIDYLTDLFALRMQLSDYEMLCKEKGRPLVFLQEISLDDLLYFCLTAIREYGKSDPIIMFNLLDAIKSLLGINDNLKCHTLLMKHAGIIIETAKNHIKNSADREKLNEVIALINAHTLTDRYLHYLKNPVIADN